MNIIQFTSKRPMLHGIMVYLNHFKNYKSNPKAKCPSIIPLEWMLFLSHQLISIMKKLFLIIVDLIQVLGTLDMGSSGNRSLRSPSLLSQIYLSLQRQKNGVKQYGIILISMFLMTKLKKFGTRDADHGTMKHI